MHLRFAFEVVRNLFRRRRMEEGLDGEIRSYIEIVTDERIASGMTPTEARRTALTDFGGMEQVKQAVRDQRAGIGVELFLKDLRFGLRQVARNPGFAAAVSITLALAIGANTAVFSLVNALMLRSLPYPHPEQLGAIFVTAHGPKGDAHSHDITGAQWELLRDNVPSLLSAVSASSASGLNLRAGDRIEYVHGGRVSARYFDVLGVRPALGRSFSEEEDLPHGPRAVILSYNLWHTIFGEDRSLLGENIRLKGEPYTVIGILPRGATSPLDADLYTALQPRRDGEGGGTNYTPIVRLRQGATWGQADAEINRAWAGWTEREVAMRGPGTRFLIQTVQLRRAVTVTLRPQILGLMAAVGFILLIACANLAGMTMVRMARRTPEMATRLALGASRWQIQRQLWVENLVLACMGGGIGIAVGFAALRGLLGLLPTGYLPVADVHLDLRVLAFTAVLSAVTSIFFGMMPAFAIRKLDVRSAMVRHKIAASEGTRVRQGLIAGEVAVTVVLLAGSGLLIRTLIHLETQPPGFDPAGVFAAKASLDDLRYRDPATFHKLMTDSVAAMKSIPGVKDAAVGLSLPYEPVLNDTLTLADGSQVGQEIVTDMLYVTPGYFATLEIPLLAGRPFAISDTAETQHVAIVNRTFARKFYAGRNPVGHTLRSGPQVVVIVGEVADVQLASFLVRVAPLQTEETVYIPAAQMTDPNGLGLLHTWFQPGWIVRTAHPVEGLAGRMQAALSGVEPGLPFSGFYAMGDLEARTLATQRIQVALLGSVGGLALLLSAVGIFALVANSVAQRTREIGIRMALGSTLWSAAAHVARIGILPVAAGLLVGLAGCLAVLPVMRNVLYGVRVYDATSIFGVVGVLAGVALVATILPTLRTARIDPARTLRED